MTKIFSNSSPKIPKSGIFVPKHKYFQYWTKLCSKINSRMQILNMTIVFSNPSPKICKSHIFGPKFRNFCFFHEISQLDKFRVLISNITILFSNSSPKYPNKAFLVSNLGIFVFFTKFFCTIFVFAPDFATRQIPRWRFKIKQQYFQIPPQKYANQAILFKDFYFVPNVAVRQVRGR